MLLLIQFSLFFHGDGRVELVCFILFVQQCLQCSQLSFKYNPIKHLNRNWNDYPCTKSRNVWLIFAIPRVHLWFRWPEASCKSGCERCHKSHQIPRERIWEVGFIVVKTFKQVFFSPFLFLGNTFGKLTKNCSVSKINNPHGWVAVRDDAVASPPGSSDDLLHRNVWTQWFHIAMKFVFSF